MGSNAALMAARRRREEALILSTVKEGMTMRITRDLLYVNGLAYTLTTPQIELERLEALYQKRYLTQDEYKLKKAELEQRT